MTTRSDYDTIQNGFYRFVECWMTHSVEGLDSILCEDVHGWLSTVKDKGGASHSLYNIRKFILDTPTGECDWQIGNYICRVQDNDAWQMAQTACVSRNGEGDFKFIAAFANHWRRFDDGWRITDLRMDLQGFDSPRQAEFAGVWHFDDPIAVLTPTAQIPCIFPEMDNPYYRLPDAPDLLAAEEQVAECWYKFNTGLDNLMFLWVKETLAEDFQNDAKRHFIAHQKFTRQRYRYNFSARTLKDVVIQGDTAVGVSRSLVPLQQEKTVRFVKRGGRWQILSIEGGGYGAESGL